MTRIVFAPVQQPDGSLSMHDEVVEEPLQVQIGDDGWVHIVTFAGATEKIRSYPAHAVDAVLWKGGTT